MQVNYKENHFNSKKCFEVIQMELLVSYCQSGSQRSHVVHRQIQHTVHTLTNTWKTFCYTLVKRICIGHIVISELTQRNEVPEREGLRNKNMCGNR